MFGGGAGTCTGVSYGYGPGTLIVGIADSVFSIGNARRVISPPAIAIIAVGVVAWCLFMLEQWLVFEEMV
jgi:hypothetical protein